MKTLGLSKKKRIHSPQEFKLLLNRGKKIRSTSFTVFVSPSKLTWNRLGVSVSKRVGKAHRRNQIKRIVREAFRHFPKQPVALDWIFLVGTKAATNSNYEIFQEIDEIFNKVIHKTVTGC